MEDLNLHFSKIVPVKMFADKVRLTPFILVCSMFAIAFLLSFSEIFGGIVVLVTGIVYPALMSFSAIYSKEIDEDKQWLTYWVLFGGLNFVDYFLGSLTESIPFYYTLKLIYVIFLFWPSTRGSYIIYEKFLFPKFLNKELDDYNSVGSSDSKVRSYKED